MLRKFLIYSFLIISTIACTAELEEENRVLKEEKERLLQERQNQDSTINDFIQAFERIQNNLGAIRAREETIREARREGDVENASEAREQVISDLEAINSLLDDNKKTIGKLEERLRRSNIEIGQFKNAVARLQQQVALKDSTISLLKEDLAALNFRVDQLNSKLGTLTETTLSQREQLKAQEAELNTAYYTIGSYKELKEAGVVDKEGGFIGLGRTKTIADDFNKSYFTQIDLRSTQSIPLTLTDGKAELLSSHSSESYQWKKSEDGKTTEALEITNPEEFWRSTRYLVVLVK